MDYEIITDTSANLPTSLLEEYGIPVLPFSYFIDGVEHTCIDTREFDGEKFYSMLKEGAPVSTSLVSTQLYLDVFDEALSQGRDVLFIGMSSGISGSYQCSVIAAEELREKYPERKIITFDTFAASLGEGIMVIIAAKMRREGATLEKVAGALFNMRPKMVQVFTVDDLRHLRRGGRISSMTAAIGTVLQIKPLLTGDDEGRIVTFGKARGRRNSLIALADEYAKRVEAPERQIVGIAHCGCPEDAEFLAKLVRQRYEPMELLNVCYEPVTGAHVGPGAVALFFFGAEKIKV